MAAKAYIEIRRKAQNGEYQSKGQEMLTLCQAAEILGLGTGAGEAPTEQDMLDILEGWDLHPFGLQQALDALQGKVKNVKNSG